MPKCSPRASIVIVHGMGEHIMRYQHIADSHWSRICRIRIRSARPWQISPRCRPRRDRRRWLACAGGRHRRVCPCGATDASRAETGVLAHSMGLFATQQALPSDSHLFDAVALFARPYALSTVSPDLPMYLAVGEMDRPAGTRPGCWTRRICGIGAEVRPHTNRAVRQDLERMHADQPECKKSSPAPG